MAEQLTPAQEQVVTDRGGKLLVSAAAGSGKTKVLVDRLLRYLSDPVAPANLDDFLIITFTKAAASELRGKIAEKLSERIAQDPGNAHLQRQIQRLYLAKISTVHSFCSDTLREYAYKLDISADFRVAEPNECERYKAKVMEQVLENAYEELPNDSNLQAFIDTQGLSRNDADIPNIISMVYENSRCHKDPDGWLDWCLDACSVDGVADPSETVWGAYLIKDLKEKLSWLIHAMEKCVAIAERTETFEKVTAILSAEVAQLQAVVDCNTWQQIVSIGGFQWQTLRFPTKTPYIEAMETIKAIRNLCKTEAGKHISIFANDSQRELQDLESSCAASRGLLRLVKDFAHGYAKIKKARHVMDYNDLEQSMLDLLLGKQRSGATVAARELGQRFREIMVDEYQDTNEVQDTIFSTICAQRNNCFMVGDVKQSIYQFRLADPTIFLEKYNTYTPVKQAVDGQPRKILLSDNFRSATEVVGAVNDVFSLCMSPKVGGLYYGEEEMLREGIPHERVNEPEIEFYCIKTDSDTYAQEAQIIAQRISELLDGTHMIRDKDNGMRPIRAEDIVVLLRSTSSNGPTVQRAIAEKGIRCAMERSEDILQCEEVGTLFSILETINNPLQDIPLAATLASRVFCFTADNLARIRAPHKKTELYYALQSSDDPKAVAFLDILKDLRRQARMCSVSQLIEYIFVKTGMDSIYSALADGPQRSANLHAFCTYVSDYAASGNRDLGQFVEHIHGLGEKGLVLENDTKPADTVMIYTIHKSKGLEYPVVILGCLSREFSGEDAKKPVLCHKELGLGMNWVDNVQRIRYPTLCKKAILKKMQEDQISEEMRVLYVAMTRAKDRLIMTHAYRYAPKQISDMVKLMGIFDREMIVASANCPGKWILYTALQRTEAGELFAVGGSTGNSKVSENPWKIRYLEVDREAETAESDVCDTEAPSPVDNMVIEKMQKLLSFRYAHNAATQIPSKQTATQLKGRTKDQEAAENTPHSFTVYRNFRKPAFATSENSGVFYGNAIHAVMQYIDFSACTSVSGVEAELKRLCESGYITSEQANAVDRCHITAFFETELGKKLLQSKHVLREFKFSVLEDADAYYENATEEKILMQGVVDCAILEDDGITVLDFKSDYVTKDTVDDAALRYRPQVRAYASALSRIYQLPVKRVALYFFRINRVLDVD